MSRQSGRRFLSHRCPSHLWGDDVEQVPGQRVLLGEDVVVVGLEGDAVHVDDEGAGRQVERDAVLPQEALQLGGLLPQELQRHLGSWKTNRGVSRNLTPPPHFFTSAS